MKGAARKKCIYACLLVAAAAVSFAHGAAAQAATCPSLTADDIGSPQIQQTLWGNVIKACSEFTANTVLLCLTSVKLMALCLHLHCCCVRTLAGVVTAWPAQAAGRTAGTCAVALYAASAAVGAAAASLIDSKL